MKKRIEAKQNEIILFEFEIQKKNKVIESLHEQLKKRDEIICEKRNELEEMRNYSKNVSQGKLAVYTQQQKDAYEKASLLAIQNSKLVSEIGILNKKFDQVEKLLFEKDNQILLSEKKAFKYREESENFPKILHQKETIIHHKDNKIAELEQEMINMKSRYTREINKNSNLCEEKMNNECLKLKNIVDCKISVIDSMKAEVSRLAIEKEEITQSLELEKEKSKSFEAQLALLKSKEGELEALLHANDRSVEIDILRSVEKDLRKRLAEQTLRSDIFENDSNILSELRIENSKLNEKIMDLQTQLIKCNPNELELMNRKIFGNNSGNGYNTSLPPNNEKDTDEFQRNVMHYFKTNRNTGVDEIHLHKYSTHCDSHNSANSIQRCDVHPTDSGHFSTINFMDSTSRGIKKKNNNAKLSTVGNTHGIQGDGRVSKTYSGYVIQDCADEFPLQKRADVIDSELRMYLNKKYKLEIYDSEKRNPDDTVIDTSGISLIYKFPYDQITRLDFGIYSFGNKIVYLRIIDRKLSVRQYGNKVEDFISIDDFIAKESFLKFG